jgi:hypothetical protein
MRAKVWDAESMGRWRITVYGDIDTKPLYECSTVDECDPEHRERVAMLLAASGGGQVRLPDVGMVESHGSLGPCVYFGEMFE